MLWKWSSAFQTLNQNLPFWNTKWAIAISISSGAYTLCNRVVHNSFCTIHQSKYTPAWASHKDWHMCDLFKLFILHVLVPYLYKIRTLVVTMPADDLAPHNADS